MNITFAFVLKSSTCVLILSSYPIPHWPQYNQLKLVQTGFVFTSSYWTRTRLTGWENAENLWTTQVSFFSSTIWKFLQHMKPHFQLNIIISCVQVRLTPQTLLMRMMPAILMLHAICLAGAAYIQSNLPPGEIPECFPGTLRPRCFYGCFNCWRAYDPRVYDLDACCRDCRLTDANIIDDGPSDCSLAYVRPNAPKRRERILG